LEVASHSKKSILATSISQEEITENAWKPNYQRLRSPSSPV
jgi:hypothetical protein